MNAMTEPLLFKQVIEGQERELVSFATHPTKYQHWTLSVDGDVARLKLDINEDGGIKPGYKLKLNSYDLGVDIELHDAINRIRFEHPAVKVVVFESGKEKIWCSGANIYMLGLSTHGWKVNFCKFTNETRNGLEDSSRHDGLKAIASVTGACAGGGYELALACDRIVMVDDRSSTVSLPEVPLLGVLPGTGGLTRVTDKRKVRRDLADIFCTTSEGVRADRAKDWKLIDAFAKPQQFGALLATEIEALRAQSTRAAASKGIELTPLKALIDDAGYHYSLVDAQVDRAARIATLTVKAPTAAIESTPETIEAAGANWYPLKLQRELDDAILNLRTNELEVGTWVIKTTGDAGQVIRMDEVLAKLKDHWLVKETTGALRRTLARIDVTSRSLIALVDAGSCYAGTFYELALACDRIYMLDLPDSPDAAPALQLSPANFGWFPAVNGLTRLQTRFYEDSVTIKQLESLGDSKLRADQALELGLVTLSPDDIDWDDEIRIMLEERASMSPDAMTGMEASLRFPGKETMETRVFGRLSAWQNWIFIRPNAVGEDGALKLFGTGKKAKFDWKRI
ncbi:benzoyl-CoA-dihydrodiol lyase [Polaromonas eurypsychrophila]|uniref:Benzoyl-CoA-dihydrodiol lyase n=2 Tax=Polaromonas eurypsychrophila TaxID=1614635 RepID=A0A916WII8_9BURK|nr:2,3-epoxybenzoyl-CoA dihydrolase [Polaromonas eurypsychrophila]GGB04336.1 benzoyl-CoA-dihydrodiol lyase [Polaromonas eurypsychrophila]